MWDVRLQHRLQERLHLHPQEKLRKIFVSNKQRQKGRHSRKWGKQNGRNFFFERREWLNYFTASENKYLGVDVLIQAICTW
jgi:hypothetical protein